MLMCGYGANDIGAMKEAPLELALFVSQRSNQVKYKVQGTVLQGSERGPFVVTT
jgi:hypothetical protein